MLETTMDFVAVRLESGSLVIIVTILVSGEVVINSRSQVADQITDGSLAESLALDISLIPGEALAVSFNLGFEDHQNIQNVEAFLKEFCGEKMFNQVTSQKFSGRRSAVFAIFKDSDIKPSRHQWCITWSNCHRCGAFGFTDFLCEFFQCDHHLQSKSSPNNVLSFSSQPHWWLLAFVLSFRFTRRFHAAPRSLHRGGCRAAPRRRKQRSGAQSAVGDLGAQRSVAFGG